MSTPEESSYTDISVARERRRVRKEGPVLSGGGGGGTFNPMEARVTALEKGFEKLDGKLDALLDAVAAGRLENEKRFGAIEGRLTGIEKTLDAKAAKSDLTPIEVKLTSVKDAIDTRAATSDLNLLAGKVKDLPTTLQLLGFVVLIFTAAGVTKWIG